MDKVQVKVHRNPYVKQYDSMGNVVNPITKDDPYFVAPKRHLPKVRKLPQMNQYVQEVPIFVDDKGNEVKLREVSFKVVDSKYKSSKYKLSHVKRIIHTID